MSEALTREQVERTIAKLQSGSPFLHQGNYLLAHDAALRQEIERLTAERDSWQEEACLVNKVSLDLTNRLAQVEQERAMIHRRYADQCASVHRLMQENAVLQSRVDELERLHSSSVRLPHGD